MYTMQDFIEKKIVVKITSRDDMHDFLQMCENKGLRWRDGKKATAMFNKAMKKRVFISYVFYLGSNTLMYSEDDTIYRIAGIITVPFSAFKNEMDEETIGVIKRKGNKIQIHIGDNHGSARCSTQDEFDLYTGCRLALDRTFGKEHEETEKPKKPIIAATAKGERIMAKEYIEREVVSEGIRKYYYKNPPNSSYQEGFDRGLDKAQRVILDAPVADVVEVRHGKWIHSEIEDDDWEMIFHKWTCSVCGYSVAHNPTGENYCPNCGAKMDEECK